MQDYIQHSRQVPVADFSLQPGGSRPPQNPYMASDPRASQSHEAQASKKQKQKDAVLAVVDRMQQPKPA